METLTYTFTNTDFKLVMKSWFRKYLDESYKGKTIVVDIDHKLLSPDELAIYRVHCIEHFFYNYYFLEKVIINRKNKTLRSKIITKMYKEECSYDQINFDVVYHQNYETMISIMSRGKKQVFENGCKVMEKIINEIDCKYKNV
jgi:hypothetical protein